MWQIYVGLVAKEELCNRFVDRNSEVDRRKWSVANRKIFLSAVIMGQYRSVKKTASHFEKVTVN